MASENETVADIVKEKRDTADEAELKGKNTFAFDLAKMLREEANRIEAAHQREVAELRKCLKEAIDYNCAMCEIKGKGCEVEGFCTERRWRKVLEATKGEEDEGTRRYPRGRSKPMSIANTVEAYIKTRDIEKESEAKQ